MKMKNRKTAKPTPAGRSIMTGLRQIQEAYASGEPLAKRFNVRTVEVTEPGEYDAAAVTRTRMKLGLSQAVFARLLGVSTSLAQSWEQGRRLPDRMGRRLLDEINRDPKHWSGMIRESRTHAA
jgi:DNA-binding transcriptional regulator YiaG